MKTSKLQQFNVSYQNSEEFHLIKREVFGNHRYYFETDNPNPFIIDAGGHIGLATLYFKKLFPQAQIIVIEPNPNLLTILEKNIWENQLKNVTLIPKALSDPNDSVRMFYQDKSPNQWWSTSSFIPGAWTGDQESSNFLVETISLDEIIENQIDLLKLDIEGAEEEVLLSCKKIALVKNLICEYHPHPNQSLSNLLEFLEQHFVIQIFKNGKLIPLKHAVGLIFIEGQNKKLI